MLNACSPETETYMLLISLLLIFGSVSDLLDYINPSRDAKGRDFISVKRKAYITKVNRVQILFWLYQIGPMSSFWDLGKSYVVRLDIFETIIVWLGNLTSSFFFLIIFKTCAITETKLLHVQVPRSMKWEYVYFKRWRWLCPPILRMLPLIARFYCPLRVGIFESSFHAFH